MNAKAYELLFNTALKVAVDATGLVPGLSQVTAILKIANDVAPALEDTVAYFESPEGQRAIAQFQTLFAAISASAENRLTFSQAAAPAQQDPDGYHWEWVGGFEGYRWVKN